MISAQLLAMMRTMTARFFTETCLIESEADGVDVRGARTGQFTTVAADMPCRVITIGGTRRDAAETNVMQETIIEEYRLVVPYDTALAEGMRVTVGGIVYQITALLTDRTDETDRQANMVRSK